MNTKPYLALALVAGLGLALGACSSSSDDDPPEMTMTDPDPEPTPDPGPTDLEETQAAAAAAAEAAGTASTNASASASSAAEATANVVTLQTNGVAAAHAYAAHKAAAEAADAYATAKAASEAAATATTGADAEAAWAMAAAAQRGAEAAEATAADMAEAAMQAAMTELHIDGTTKNVGDTSITVDGVMRTSGSGATTKHTGLLASKIEQSFEEVDGVTFVAGTDPVPNTAYVQAVEARNVSIGDVYDSTDDTARLTLIKSYTDTVDGKVFAYTEAAPDASATTALRTAPADMPGKIQTNAGTEATAEFGDLEFEGMFYQAGSDDNADALEAADAVADDAKAVRVYSHTDDADATTYLVRHGERTVGSETTIIYRSVSVLVNSSDATTDGTAETAMVTAAIPKPIDYKYLHYGLWNVLKDETGDGDNNSIADLGIGFVTGQKDDSRTGTDMPNVGMGSYEGNWVASVQANQANEGAISRQSGESTLTADFLKNTLTADLSGLATLEGSISEDGFEGTKVTGVMADKGNLTANADGTKFSGSFSGAFYGPKAAEAGGIFDYTSAKDGAFRGSFGGSKQ